MSHDGTTHADAPEITARNIVDLYLKNINQYATPYDIYLVGNAILGRTDSVDEAIVVIEEEVTTLTEDTESEFRTVEQRLTDIEEVLALLIFELNEIGFSFTNKIEEFRNDNLNI